MRIDTVTDDRLIAEQTTVLLVCEDAGFLGEAASRLEYAGYRTSKTSDMAKARSRLELESVKIVIVDLYMTFDDPTNLPDMPAIAGRRIEMLGMCYPDDTEKIFECLERGFTGIVPRHLGSLDRFEAVVRAAARRSYLHAGGGSHVRELESAMAVASALSMTGLSFTEKLDRCLEIVLKHFDAGRGSIFLMDRSKTALEIVANSKKDLVGERVSLEDNSVAAWVARNRKKLNVDDVTQIPEFDFSKAASYKKNSFLVYPIILQDKVLGVFNITDRSSGPFTAMDESALSRFLERIAVTIENAMLTETIKEERAKLAAANVELKNLEELKNNLVSMLVHDLKGPIGEVMANLSMLEGAKLEDFETDTLMIAQAGIESLQGMVMDILDVNRMEEGKFHLKQGDVDLRGLAEDKMGHLSGLLRLDNKTMEISDDGVGGYIAHGDASIIKRVLANLVTNAVNYTPEDGKITILLQDGGEFWKLGVQDEGPGIPEESKEVIFQKFGTVKGDSRKSKFSTGLGLTFCKMAMEAHGGKIWVENHPGGGSVFFITLAKA